MSGIFETLFGAIVGVVASRIMHIRVSLRASIVAGIVGAFLGRFFNGGCARVPVAPLLASRASFSHRPELSVRQPA